MERKICCILFFRLKMMMTFGIKLLNEDSYIYFDHVDNKQLSKKIKPLPVHSRVVYLKKISHITQILSDSLVGCPSSVVIRCRLTKKLNIYFDRLSTQRGESRGKDFCRNFCCCCFGESSLSSSTKLCFGKSSL